MEQLNSSVTLVELKRTLVPPSWDSAARRVTMSECKEVGLSLAHSFAADDLSQYLVDADDMTHLSLCGEFAPASFTPFDVPS